MERVDKFEDKNERPPKLLDLSSNAKNCSFAVGSQVKPATHLAILYADRGDRRKSSGVPDAAIAIFADCRERRIKSPISGMSDIGDFIRRHSPSVSVPAIFYAHRCELPVKSINQVGRFYHMNNAEVPSAKKIARCARINRWRKSLAIFAGDQIRRDRRIKSPVVSPA